MCSTIKEPHVQVSEGTLRGRPTSSVLGTKYYSFLGIPYALPPVGSLRFKPPVPVQPWNGVRDAFEEGPCAPSIAFGSLDVDPTSNEDCLYLNVYTKKLSAISSSEKVPVMVWIHGGGFTWGSGSPSFYAPDYLIKKDIVLVTINYRLGALGFLSLQNEACPGNNGLRDQVEALRWVQRNISAFGGDPNNVTIFGESAGGASVHYHLLSPLSKGLFHRAIIQSGSVLNSWAHSRRPVECAFALGAELGLKTTDMNDLLEFLKAASPADIVLKSLKVVRLVEPDNFYTGSAFVPCIEPDFPLAFLSKKPADLMREGLINDVPCIVGVNTLEGPIMVKAGREITEPKTKEEWERILPIHPAIQKGTPIADSVLQKIRNYHFAGGFSKERYADILSWEFFLFGVDESVRYLAQASGRRSQTFYYQYTFEGLSVFKPIMGFTGMKGTFHGDELPYLFYSTLMKPTLKPNDVKMMEILTTLWTDFAIAGNPTPKTKLWRPFSSSEQNYLEINLASESNKEMNAEDAKFWRALFNELEEKRHSKL